MSSKVRRHGHSLSSVRRATELPLLPPNPTPFSSRADSVMVLLIQHTSAQGSRLVTIALGPKRLGGRVVAK